MKTLIEKLLRGESVNVTAEEADKLIKDIEENGIQDYMEANVRYGLPFQGIGSCYRGPDFNARQVGANRYEMISTQPTHVNPSNPFGVLGSMPAITPICHSIDAATMKKVIDGEHMPHLGLYRLTPEEEKTLENLEVELSAWKRQQRLTRFKALPTHLRQEIVDEALFKDLMRELDDMKVKESDFPDYELLSELRSKRRPDFRMHNGIYGQDTKPGYQFKYWPLLNEFSTEELMQAHAEASLEDEIVD